VRRTGRSDKTQVEVKAKIKAKVKAEVKVEENLEFLGLMVFIGFIAFVVSIESSSRWVGRGRGGVRDNLLPTYQ